MVLIGSKKERAEATYRRSPRAIVATLCVLLLGVAFARAAEALPREGRASGTIIDASTRKPVPLAFINVIGSKLPPVATDATDGFFITYELTDGQHTLRVTHEGYLPAEIPVAIQAGKILPVQIELSPLAKKTRFLISVSSQGVPVNAKVWLRGPVQKEISASGLEGGAAITEVPPGQYAATVIAQAYLAQTRQAQIAEGTEQSLVFNLRPEPSKRVVAVKGKTIDFDRRIRFDSGRAVILLDSYLILDELVDTIIKNDIHRIRVEGHTDKEGNKARNLQLSEQRARAVAEYLVKLGIEAGRIETRGYGGTRPVVPNLTARGRAFNRRMEIYILDSAN